MYIIGLIRLLVKCPLHVGSRHFQMARAGGGGVGGGGGTSYSRIFNNRNFPKRNRGTWPPHHCTVQVDAIKKEHVRLDMVLVG